MHILRGLQVLLGWFVFASLNLHAAADSSYLSHGEGDGFKCAGIYGSPHESKGRRSTIAITIPPVPSSNITIAIFDYSDSKWIGVPVRDGKRVPDAEAAKLGSYIGSRAGASGHSANDGIQRFVLCNNETISMDLCSNSDFGRPLLNDRDDKDQPRAFKSVIYNDYLMLNRSGVGYTRLEDKEHSNDNDWHKQARTSIVDGAKLEWLADGTLKINYYVNTTGFYCVDAISLGDFIAHVEWINVDGLLPASDYPKLYVYLALMIAYIAIAIAWAFMSWRVWSEILPVQNQLLGLVCLLAVDMGMNFGFWKYFNSKGAPSTVYSVFTLVIDAGRNSLSFFMLLVVSLGWGVVRPSLGKTMIRCILLAVVHFTAGCLYGAGLLFRDPHESGPLGLLYVIPLSMSLAMFYLWILSAIIATINLLADRQQTFKLAMYTRLWRLLLVCLVMLFAFFVLNIIYTISYTRIEVAAWSWRWLWFWTDGWLNFEYFVALCVILYWWRPTLQNYRYSLEELASNEDEAAEREQAFAHDSFDNPQMGEDLELDVLDATTKKTTSISGDDVQFVISNEDDEEDDTVATATASKPISSPHSH
ncbi:lung seven transmembrane receptor-domain-containing protein [Coemansia mojavensis]|nr:lung seven transmembrane receptor-domain-containing protein [Coemansia mojavensis]